MSVLTARGWLEAKIFKNMFQLFRKSNALMFIALFAKFCIQVFQCREIIQRTKCHKTDLRPIFFFLDRPLDCRNNTWRTKREWKASFHWTKLHINEPFQPITFRVRMNLLFNMYVLLLRKRVLTRCLLNKYNTIFIRSYKLASKKYLYYVFKQQQILQLCYQG